MYILTFDIISYKIKRDNLFTQSLKATFFAHDHHGTGFKGVMIAKPVIPHDAMSSTRWLWVSVAHTIQI